MYYNMPGKGRRKTRQYASWIQGELKALIAQRARPFTERATVSITIPNHTRGDCDSRIKATLDLLVRAGILKDDRSDFVKAVSVTFGDVQCLHVKIEAA